jgi:hypothetical protein
MNWKKSTKTYRNYSDQFGCLLAFVLCMMLPGYSLGQLSANGIKAYSAYVHQVESRIAQQHVNRGSFIAAVNSSRQNQARLRNGELVVEALTPATSDEFSGSMLHHWRGTAFVPRAKAADLERILKNFNAYPQYFSPQVLQAKILSQQGDRMQAVMRVRQKHVITVVLDSTYEINFGRLDAQHGYSSSVSTHISEIEQPSTSKERALSEEAGHGFLWRQNTYWSYAEADGGLYMQIESVSLSRAIPTGLGWAVKPFVESVPRESMEFTLRSAGNALKP